MPRRYAQRCGAPRHVCSRYMAPCHVRAYSAALYMRFDAATLLARYVRQWSAMRFELHDAVTTCRHVALLAMFDTSRAHDARARNIDVDDAAPRFASVYRHAMPLTPPRASPAFTLCAHAALERARGAWMRASASDAMRVRCHAPSMIVAIFCRCRTPRSSVTMRCHYYAASEMPLLRDGVIFTRIYVLLLPCRYMPRYANAEAALFCHVHYAAADAMVMSAAVDTTPF